MRTCKERRLEIVDNFVVNVFYYRVAPSKIYNLFSKHILQKDDGIQPWHGSEQLVTSLSPQRYGADTTLVCVKFMVDRMAVVQGFPMSILAFPSASSSYNSFILIHYHITSAVGVVFC